MYPKRRNMLARSSCSFTSFRKGSRTRVARWSSAGSRSGLFGTGCSNGSKPPAIEKAMKPLTTDGVAETRWIDLNPRPNLPVVAATGSLSWDLSRLPTQV